MNPVQSAAQAVYDAETAYNNGPDQPGPKNPLWQAWADAYASYQTAKAACPTCPPPSPVPNPPPPAP